MIETQVDAYCLLPDSSCIAKLELKSFNQCDQQEEERKEDKTTLGTPQPFRPLFGLDKLSIKYFLQPRAVV